MRLITQMLGCQNHYKIMTHAQALFGIYPTTSNSLQNQFTITEALTFGCCYVYKKYIHQKRINLKHICHLHLCFEILHKYSHIIK